jgi:aryl-alcohol dehydrogenase-like predicted oxidoreductase
MGYGDLSKGTAWGLLSAAWEMGIRWVDTAPSYGAGEGLRRVQDWQHSTGCRFEVVMKPGRPLVGGHPVSNLAIESIQQELDCCTAVVGPPSAILLKDPPSYSLRDGSLFKIIAEVERRHPGVVCGFASHDLAMAACAPPASQERIAQIEVSGLNWRLARRVANQLAAAGWAIWAIQPLSYGFLAGRQACTFGADDFRSRIPRPTQRLLEAGARSFLATLRRFLDKNESKNLSAAMLSLAFCLSLPYVTRVVVGPKSRSQLAEAFQAEQLAMVPEMRATLVAFQSSNGNQ